MATIQTSAEPLPLDPATFNTMLRTTVERPAASAGRHRRAARREARGRHPRHRRAASARPAGGDAGRPHRRAALPRHVRPCLLHPTQRPRRVATPLRGPRDGAWPAVGQDAGRLPQASEDRAGAPAGGPARLGLIPEPQGAAVNPAAPQPASQAAAADAMAAPPRPRPRRSPHPPRARPPPPRPPPRRQRPPWRTSPRRRAMTPCPSTRPRSSRVSPRPMPTRGPPASAVPPDPAKTLCTCRPAEREGGLGPVRRQQPPHRQAQVVKRPRAPIDAATAGRERRRRRGCA